VKRQAEIERRLTEIRSLSISGRFPAEVQTEMDRLYDELNAIERRKNIARSGYAMTPFGEPHSVRCSWPLSPEDETHLLQAAEWHELEGFGAAALEDMLNLLTEDSAVGHIFRSNILYHMREHNWYRFSPSAQRPVN